MWHGRVDVLLGPYPVAVVAKSSDDYFEDDIDGSLSSFEVEEHRNYTQIVAQSIVFAFLQKKMNPYFENFLIPTVGISRKNVVFYLYDPEHDILLESSQFDLIVDNTSLYYPTILALWLTLNYKTFCTGITKSMKERNFTTDILSSVSNDIKTIYKEQLRFGNCAIGQKPEPFRASIAQGLTLTRCKPWKPRKAVRS